MFKCVNKEQFCGGIPRHRCVSGGKLPVPVIVSGARAPAGQPTSDQWRRMRSARLNQESLNQRKRAPNNRACLIGDGYMFKVLTVRCAITMTIIV